MKAQETKFLNFLAGHNANFVIPVYQRNYDWKKDQCKQLFDDIIQISNENYKSHFMGAIVVFDEDGHGGQELLIIDGQQRLTTISLLLLALYKVLKNNNFKTDITKEEIHDIYLINKFSKDKSKKIRLKPAKKARDAFNSIFEGEEKNNSETNVVVNYNYFYNRILEQEIPIDDLFKSIEKLIIVEVILKAGEDDPQLIFESLNSTGLDLTEADKVRNYILMKENTEKQEKLYNKYWSKIEENTRINEVDYVSSFLRDYLTFIERKIPTKSKVYLIFKDFIKKNDFDNSIEKLLIKLLQFSEYYKIIINSSDENKEISKVLKRINKLETVVAYPFLLELYSKLEVNIINKDDLLKILLTIESFVFRRFICGVPTNALNKIFMLLSKDIESHDGYKTDYVNIFNFVLLQKKGSQKFPNNLEFSEKLLIKDIYNIHGRNQLHLLERLENFDNKESDIERLLYGDDDIDKKLTIEHIMPQTLTNKWEKELGEKYNEIHERYLHTLGNITLTGYNSKYSNKSFEEKKSMEKGFNESHLYLNGFLKTIDKWNEENIKNRYNLLQNKALKIWELPKTTYIIKKDETKIFTLSDEKNFTGEDILEYDFEDKNYKVNSWTTFYENIIKTLFEKDPVLMNSFINDEYLSTKFKDSDVNNEQNFIKINEGLFIKVNTNTESKLYSLREVFKRFDINLDNLSFYIK